MFIFTGTVRALDKSFALSFFEMRRCLVGFLLDDNSHLSFINSTVISDGVHFSSVRRVNTNRIPKADVVMLLLIAVSLKYSFVFIIEGLIVTFARNIEYDRFMKVGFILYVHIVVV